MDFVQTLTSISTEHWFSMFVWDVCGSTFTCLFYTLTYVPASICFLYTLCARVCVHLFSLYSCVCVCVCVHLFSLYSCGCVYVYLSFLYSYVCACVHLFSLYSLRPCLRPLVFFILLRLCLRPLVFFYTLASVSASVV